VVGVLTLAVVVLVSVYQIQRRAGLERAYDSITLGMTRDEVVARSGEPMRTTDGTASVYGPPKTPALRTPGCVEELWYVAFFSPEQWAYCFDERQILVGKFPYKSY
jgi:hypothetical protein